MIIMMIITDANGYEIKVEQLDFDTFNEDLESGGEWLAISGWSTGTESKVVHFKIRKENIEAVQWRVVK